MKNLRLQILHALILGLWMQFPPTAARAELLPAKGRFDSRIRTALYNAADVYRLHGFVGYQIDLQFEAGESFIGLGAGDIEGLSFESQDNHLFLKPKAPKVETNLTILTTRRHYQIDYTASAHRRGADQAEAIYALQFIYPAHDSSSSEFAAVDARLGETAAYRARNSDYWYCGNAGLKPEAASDDGVRTRLRFAARAELPAIFLRNDDGSESLVNFNVEGGEIFVQRISRRFVLRRGALVGCIVNKGYVAGGARLESGTVAPNVERAGARIEP